MQGIADPAKQPFDVLNPLFGVKVVLILSTHDIRLSEINFRDSREVSKAPLQKPMTFPAWFYLYAVRRTDTTNACEAPCDSVNFYLH